MVEIGRLIQGRYLVQRLIKHGQSSVVYQGFDQQLQRPVALKMVDAVSMSAYRVAIKKTAQFSHPNIVNLYDLLAEPEVLYLVYEYLDGEDFAALLQTQQTPYQVADLGLQVCQALLYAGSPARKVCHGDLTPVAITRSLLGIIRVNNFALPSDLSYFTDWSVMGSNSIVVADRELPWGQLSEGRRADDTRAVGLLLYQLLTSRPPGTMKVDAPEDGCLRFMRSAPAELCEVIARTVVRQHPQYIATPHTLYEELKRLIDMFEPPLPHSVERTYQAEEIPQQFEAEKLVNILPMREAEWHSSAYAVNADTQMVTREVTSTASLIADVPIKPTLVRPYQRPSLSLPVLLLFASLIFIACFIIGFFLTSIFFPIGP